MNQNFPNHNLDSSSGNLDQSNNVNTFPNQNSPIPVVRSNSPEVNVNNVNIPNDTLNQTRLNLTTNDERFIKNQDQPNEALSSLNIKDNYNNERINNAMPINKNKVKQNKKMVAIPITKELKLVVIISLILLIFICIVPFIYDLFRRMIY